jgi:multiple sugar transport system permease protein
MTDAVMTEAPSSGERASHPEPPTRQKSAHRRRQDLLLLVGQHTVLIVLSVVFLVPLFWMASGALKTQEDLGAYPVVWFPDTLTFGNLLVGFQTFPFVRYLVNTLLIAIPSMIGAALSSAFIAYGVAKIRWRYGNIVFGVLLATMMIPFYVTMVPLFMLYKSIGWTGTTLPLIVPAFLGVPFFVFLMRQFVLQIPESLSEAARLDGAGEFHIFWRIVLPLCKPALGAVALFQFLNSWSDLLGPLIYLTDSDTYTLSLGLTFFQGQTAESSMGPLMAMSTVIIIPVVILFFFAQRTFIEGVTMTGIKE